MIAIQSIFNNPQQIAEGWYLAGASHSWSVGQARSIDLCGQRIVVFRGEDGQARALDAYCPHLGTDLGIGQVEGNWIRCFFHHWAFDQTGHCRSIPCQAEIPPQARVRSYATCEKYGFIWVYPQSAAPYEVAEFDELNSKPVLSLADRPLQRRCHHHICMMNGIDAQHLQTVHGLSINMSLSIQTDPSQRLIDFTLTGEIPDTTWRERIARRLLGPTYSYSMRYADGCLGLLTMMKSVRWIPPLHLIYAYIPLNSGGTQIQPIYVTEHRSGLWGWILSQLLLQLTRLAYYALRHEDGLIYDNIRFDPQTLLAIDAPLSRYMKYVNQLKPSQWSEEDSTESAIDNQNIPRSDSSRLQ